MATEERFPRHPSAGCEEDAVVVMAEAAVAAVAE
jgi:hypothetical protein